MNWNSSQSGNNILVKLGQICGRRRWCRQGITIYDIDHDGERGPDMTTYDIDDDGWMGLNLITSDIDYDGLRGPGMTAYDIDYDE